MLSETEIDNTDFEGIVIWDASCNLFQGFQEFECNGIINLARRAQKVLLSRNLVYLGGNLLDVFDQKYQ